LIKEIKNNLKGLKFSKSKFFFAFTKNDPYQLQNLASKNRVKYCRFSHDVTKIQTTKTIDPSDLLLQ